VNTLDVYEDDFIDDGMDDDGASSSSSSDFSDEMVGAQRQQQSDDSGGQEDGQLNLSARGTRKRRLVDKSSDAGSSDGSMIVVRKKQTPVRYRAVVYYA